jgi:DNA polymerase zeta
MIDPRNEPRRSERVPFVLVNGPPNSTLIKLVQPPLEVLNDENLKINSLYYITKQVIPPLNRCFLLLGVDVNEWFAELPKKHSMILSINSSNQNLVRKGTISQFFNSTNCVTCERVCDKGICESCEKNSQHTCFVLSNKVQEIENKFMAVREMCKACCGRGFNFKCISLDCPTLYSLTQINREFQQLDSYRNILDQMF